MASTHKHIRSGTANKRPTTAIADGQIALNTNTTSPGLYFKDSTGASIIKVGPVHVGSTAPNVTPPTGGSSGNSTGEVWLDTSLTPAGVKIWDGSAWVNATPVGSTTVQGLLELATSAETQAGSDTDRAVTPAGLQSKLSDSTSTTSSTTIASSTAVKAAYDLAAAALPKSGGTITGNLEIGTTGSLTFEGATADAFETTLAVVDPTADRTITLPNTTGTVVTTGDTGTVTSTMLLDGTVVDADINANAEIAVSKLADGAARQLLQTDAAGTGVEWASNIDIPGTLDVTSAATFDSTVAVTGALTKSGNNVVTVGDTGTVTSTMLLDGTILNADVNASAAIAGTKISPDFGSQTIVTTGVYSAAGGSAAAPSIVFTGDTNTGIYSPGADQIAITTGGTGRLFIDSSGRLLAGTSTARTNFFGTTLSAVTQTEGTGGAAGRGALSVINNDVSNNPPYLLLGRSGAASLGSNAVVVSGSRLGTLTFQGADGTNFIEAATVAGEVDGTPGANDMPGRLVFSTTADGAASPTERLRITSAGLVGLGTSSPSYLLDVNGQARFSGSPIINSTSLDINPASGQPNISFRSGSTYRGYLEGNSSGGFSIGTGPAATIAMTIDSSQRVGIGTSAPSELLMLNGATPAALVRTSNAAGNAQIKFSADDTNYAGIGLENTALVLRCSNSSTPTSRVTITNGGLVGIGTSDPRGIVHVGADLNNGATDAAAVNFKQTSTTAATGIYLERSGERKGYYIYLGGVQDSLNFQRNNAGTKADVMTLTRDGNVGIGTTGPGSSLHVIGTGIRFSNVDNPSYYGSITHDASFTGANIYNSQDSGGHIFQISGSEKARIDSSGRLLVGTSSWSGSSSNAGGIEIISTNYVAGGQVTEKLGSWRASMNDNNGGADVGIDYYRMPRGGGIQSGTEIRFFTGYSYLGGTFQRMVIDQNGTITFNAYGAGTLSTNASGVISASDGRYKTKTRQLDNSLDVIAALKPTYYKWNEGSPFASEHEELGFVAQEVAAVIPEASPGEDEEGKYRNYHDRAIIAMLVRGMQEQQAMIAALNSRVAFLEGA